MINLLLILLIAASVTSGLLVYNATGRALSNLDDNYTFVASMVSSVPLEYPEGNISIRKKQLDYMNLDDFRACCCIDDILAYNVVINDKLLFLPKDQALYDFRDESEIELDTIDTLYTDCCLCTTNDLYLERGFFEGKYKMVSGSGFSNEAYKGTVPEIVLPVWFAEERGIKVGDTICCYIDLVYISASYAQGCIKCTVSGIYENSGSPDSHTESSAYIPLQFFMRSGVYSGVNSYLGGTLAKQFRVARADFVLRDRDAFTAFAGNAVKNGVDTNKVDIVFNNAEYDMIRDGLLNVQVVVTVLVLIVSVAGVGILATFTINMIMARRREKDVLRAVGMKKSAVALMFAAELLLVMLLALPLGFFTGRIVSAGICRYADGMVEGDVEELRLINRSETSVDELLLPLSCNIKMSITSGTVEAQCGNYVPYRLDESGIDVRIVDIFNSNAENYTEAKTSVYTPLKLAVADTDDISPLVAEDHAQEFVDSGMFLNATLLTYVPRSSGYEIGDRILGIANQINMDYSSRAGMVQPLYLLVCGYFDDDLLGLEGDVFFTTEQEFLKTERKIYIEILPHCDMVINPTEK
ncbi:MAG: hypothetical protein J5940_05930 [Clostridia bacterium]|nr:hypothetical protein [Clostridia bacterium]